MPSAPNSETINCYLNHGGGGNPAVAALAKSLGCRTYFAEDGIKPGTSLVWGVLRGSVSDVLRPQQSTA